MLEDGVYSCRIQFPIAGCALGVRGSKSCRQDTGGEGPHLIVSGVGRLPGIQAELWALLGVGF